jgi:hypothetical protein
LFFIGEDINPLKPFILNAIVIFFKVTLICYTTIITLSL